MRLHSSAVTSQCAHGHRPRSIASHAFSVDHTHSGHCGHCGHCGHRGWTPWAARHTTCTCRTTAPSLQQLRSAPARCAACSPCQRTRWTFFPGTAGLGDGTMCYVRLCWYNMLPAPKLHRASFTVAGHLRCCRCVLCLEQIAPRTGASSVRSPCVLVVCRCYSWVLRRGLPSPSSIRMRHKSSSMRRVGAGLLRRAPNSNPDPVGHAA